MKHCTQIEDLLPLYVEGDLDRETETGVRSHLSACRTCAALAEEFTASQQWLHSYSPPDFDSDSFAASRRAVLEQASRRGRSWVMFARSLAPMPRLAMAMLVIAILAGVIVATITLTRSPRSASDRSALQANAPRDETGVAPSKEKEGEEPQKAFVPVQIPPTNRPQDRKTPADKAIQSVIRLAALAPPVRPPLGSALDSSFEQSIAGGLGPSDADPADTEMLRIEIETGNPEIRIIWFTPKALDSLEKPATEISTESIQETL
jgi:anti-sigma factor RsiW